MEQRCSSSPIPSGARDPYSLTRFIIRLGSAGHDHHRAQAGVPVPHKSDGYFPDHKGRCRHRQGCLRHVFLTSRFTLILQQMWPLPGAINLSRFSDHRHSKASFLLKRSLRLRRSGLRKCFSLRPPALAPAQSHCPVGTLRTGSPVCQTRYRSRALYRA